MITFDNLATAENKCLPFLAPQGIMMYFYGYLHVKERNFPFQLQTNGALCFIVLGRPLDKSLVSKAIQYRAQTGSAHPNEDLWRSRIEDKQFSTQETITLRLDIQLRESISSSIKRKSVSSHTVTTFISFWLIRNARIRLPFFFPLPFYQLPFEYRPHRMRE